MVYRTRVEQGKVVLEAWAVVHNDSPEDWTDVSMTLVSGLPTSYVLSLASPRYVDREVMEAPGAAAEMMPQLGAATPDSLLYTWDITHEGYGGLSTFGYGSGGGGYGYGYGSGGGALFGASGGSGEVGSSLLALGTSAAAETMQPAVEDEISTYTSMTKVTLPSGSTSLVPLVRRELPGQAFSRIAGWGDPDTCVRIENTTGLVLQPGMSTFFEDGRFRGQASLDRVEPGDVRVLCFGKDEDVTFERKTEVKNLYSALEWKNEDLWVHTLRTTTIDYTIENMAGQPRDVAIEVAHVENGRIVTPPDNLDTDVPTVELHPLTVPGISEVEIRIVVEEGVMSLAALTDQAFGWYLGEESVIHPDQMKLLAEVRPIIVEKEKLDAQAAEKGKQISKLEEAVAWQEDLLAKVPETDGKSKSVDSILAEIVKAKKQIATLVSEIEALHKKSEDLLEKADKALSAMPRVAITVDSLKAASPSL